MCTGCSGRCGEIWALKGAPDAERLLTPMCLLYTQAGSVPHLTCDMLRKIKDVDHQPALFPLPPLVSFSSSVQEFGGGISKFTGMPTHPAFVRIQDPMKSTPSGFNDKAGVSVWDQGGRVHLNAPSFTRVMESFKPSCYQALCDSDTPKDATKKRLQRAVERTTSLLDQCIAAKSASSALSDSCILGTVVGGYSREHRIASVKEIVKRDVDGYVIEGFHVDGPASQSLKYEEIKDLLEEIVSHLPEDKPRFMHGILRPELILKAAMNGVDIFDTAFANAATDGGMALSFHCSCNEDLLLMLKGDLLEHQLALDMKSCSYRDQFTPLLEECTCYACKHFTRAYINHLLNTGEMLAYVLLNLHNIHHFLKFFGSIRKFLRQLCS
ncbi:queuine tRNA-ribosyltransferase accessory subunit 2 [Amblyomma americanum]